MNKQGQKDAAEDEACRCRWRCRCDDSGWTAGYFKAAGKTLLTDTYRSFLRCQWRRRAGEGEGEGRRRKLRARRAGQAQQAFAR